MLAVTWWSRQQRSDLGIYFIMSNQIRDKKKRATGTGLSVYGCQYFPLFNIDSGCLVLCAQDCSGLNVRCSCFTEVYSISSIRSVMATHS